MEEKLANELKYKKKQTSKKTYFKYFISKVLSSDSSICPQLSIFSGPLKVQNIVFDFLRKTK